MALGSASARPLELEHPKSHAKGFDALRDHDGPPDERGRKASLRLRMRSALDSVLLVMARSLYVWGKGWRSLVAGARGNKRDGPKAAPKRPWGLKPLPGLLARDAEFGMGDGNIFGPTLECRIFGRLKPFECELALIDPFDCGDPEPLELTLLVPVGIETVARATCPTRGTRDGALQCFWGGF